MNTYRIKKQKFYEEHGFSITEIAVVLVMITLMMVPLYSILFHIADLKPDNERFEIIQEGLAEHLRVTGTLPCPADMTLDMNAAGGAAYLSNCAGAISAAGGDVLIGSVPIDNIRAAVNCADSGLLGATGDALSSLKESVFSISEVLTGEKGATDGEGDAIGTDRAENIRCPLREYLVDENKNKFIYAVTTDATNPGFDMFDTGAGEIIVRDANGNNATTDRQIYILVSVGPDGKGARIGDGFLSGKACNLADGIDAENCDNDEVFVASPKNDAIGPNYFDDVIDFGIAGFMSEENFWQWGDLNGGGRDVILNTNSRLVIDPVDPTQTPLADLPDDDDSLYVNRGGIRVEGGLEAKAKTRYNTVTGTNETNGGTVETENSISVTNRSNAKKRVVAKHYCYKDSLVGACVP